MTLLLRERRVQEDVHDFQRQAGSGDQRAQSKHVGVVVQTGGFGREAIPAQRAADAGHLVGGDGDADAGATDDDAFFALARCHGMGHRLAIDGVIHRSGRITAEVPVFQSALPQVSQNLLLEFVSAVVAGDGDHLTPAPLQRR